MPFNSNSGYEFSESGIAAYAPASSGVYGIYNGKQWIYIDEAQEIEMRLYAHFRGESDQSARIMPQQPAYFIFERCDSRSGPVRKAELIREHRPCCNLT
jgi:excinuclease UvrABC nuclease subunit